MGPGGAFLLIMLLLGFGAFYWLSHNPNALDAFSDLRKELEGPASPAPAQPAPPNAGADTAGSAVPTEEGLRKAADAQMAQLEKDLAEAEGQLGADSPAPSPLVFVADPTCAPIGRQWLVSGHVANSSDKVVRSAKAKITLLIDGEPAEAQTVAVGPVAPQGVVPYQALFRPTRDTRNHTVTARASWER